MPWTKGDVERHKKGLSDRQKEVWVKVANAALKRCLGEGRSQDDCEGSAIRQANKVAGNMKEYKAHTMSTSNVLISVNAIDVDGEAVPVAELVAAYLTGADGSEEEQADEQTVSEAVWSTAFVNDLPDSSFALIEPGGEKDEEGKTKPRSLRHLPYKDAGGKVDIPHLRNALARLPQMKGVSAELKNKALKKLQAVAKKHLKTHQEETAEVGESVTGSLHDYANRVEDSFRLAFGRRSANGYIEGPWTRDVFKDDLDLGDAIIVRDDGKMYAVDYEENKDGFTFADRSKWQEVILTYKRIESQSEMAETQLSESASGHAIGLAETQAAASGPRAPLLMDVALIRPGWGNKKDNHYYPAEVLKRDASIFEGIKMYATDHRPEEKSVRTEVAVIKTCPVAFTNDGAPIARVAVHDGDFAEQTRNRARLGTLSSLECSILATGRTKKGKVDGEKGNIVEAIIKGQSVDWVTKGGAGGHAHALVESAGGDDMSEEEQVTQEQEQEEVSQEATLTEDGGGEEEITYLAESEVKAALEASRLPQQAQGRLSEGRYLNADALKAAIEQERTYIKEITGSGKPFAQGGGTAPGEERMSEADYEAEYADILRRHGLHVPQRQEAN